MKKIPKHHSTLPLNSSPFLKNIHNLLRLGGTLVKGVEGDVVVVVGTMTKWMGVVAWVMVEWVTVRVVEFVSVPRGVSHRIRTDGRTGEGKGDS
jgi:hypothetical protein